MSVSQFYCDDSSDDSSENVASCPTVSTLQGEPTQWRFVSEYVAAGREWQWYYVAWLLFTVAVIRILVAITVHKVSYLKR